jgi:uncharacterized membrane protein
MTRLYWTLALAFTLAAFAASAWLYPQMPERIPIHWNIHGHVDGYGSKALGLFLMPGAMVVILALFAALPWLSPRHFEVSSFRSITLYLMVVVTGLFGVVHAFTLYAAVHGGRDLGNLLAAAIFLFFALIGNVLGKVRPNFYIGVRTPWTLASQRVWADTHRLAAWLFVAGGLLGFALALLGWVVVAFSVVMVAALVPVLYSLFHYKRLERRGEL